MDVTSGVDLDPFPAHNVKRAKFVRDNLVALHTYEVAAFRPGLANVPALNVAWIKNDRAVLMQELPLVNVSECPVVVAALPQMIQGTWRIRAVPRAPLKGGMEHADIEPAFCRIGISSRQIVTRLARSEALTMHCDSEVLQVDRFRHVLREKV